MNDPSATPPGGLPVPHVDAARIARTWAGVEARLDDRGRRRRRDRVAAVASSLALAAAVLLAWWFGPYRAAAPHVAEQSAPPDVVVLPEGSRVTPVRGARYKLIAATKDTVTIELEAGEIDLDVSHVEGRSFTVRAGGHEATVLGTRFRVRNEHEIVAVTVERGRVRVSGPNVDHILGAGETWSTDARARPPPPRSAESAPQPEIDALSPAAPSSTRPGADAHPAKELFVRALDARRAGRDREAATRLDQLRRTYRSDPRAPLAAYELGRIRLDVLGDPAGAAEAFADAILLSPSAPFREDAEARRVDALEAAGDRGRCEEARAAYLARYPSGIHARRMLQRCTAN